MFWVKQICYNLLTTALFCILGVPDEWCSRHNLYREPFQMIKMISLKCCCCNCSHHCLCYCRHQRFWPAEEISFSGVPGISRTLFFLSSNLETSIRAEKNLSDESLVWPPFFDSRGNWSPEGKWLPRSHKNLLLIWHLGFCNWKGFWRSPKLTLTISQMEELRPS